jgi:hypothetical protein
MNPASAQHLLANLARVELDDLRHHHVELVAATADLARAARLDWPWTQDDPTVAVLRALSKIAIIAPGATSPRAAALGRQLANHEPAAPSETDDVADSGNSSGPATGSHR